MAPSSMVVTFISTSHPLDQGGQQPREASREDTGRRSFLLRRIARGLPDLEVGVMFGVGMFTPEIRFGSKGYLEFSNNNNIGELGFRNIQLEVWFFLGGVVRKWMERIFDNHMRSLDIIEILSDHVLPESCTAGRTWFCL